MPTAPCCGEALTGPDSREVDSTSAGLVAPAALLDLVRCEGARELPALVVVVEPARCALLAPSFITVTEMSLSSCHQRKSYASLLSPTNTTLWMR